jgi:hypothetical protein
MDPSRGCAKHLHPADSGSPDMGHSRYPQPCALPTRPWKLLSVESFDGAAVSGHVSGACRVSTLSTFTRPGSTLVRVCLFMCTLVLNSRESPSRSHRRCWVKARGRAPAGFAQEAGDIETASWLETGALRGHIAILEAVPSCEKFLPCAESSCGRVDKFRGGSLRIRSTYLQIPRPATEGSGSSRHRTDYTGSVFPLLKPCDDARREAQVQSCNRANVRSHCNTQRGSANDHHTE